jgi:hypothetical protein
MTNIDKIKEQAKSLEALSGLDANKSHGIFSSLLQWVSFIWRDMENMFQEHVKQVENLLQRGQAFSVDWWRKKVMAFQYGDDLVFVNGDIIYGEDKPEKRIVTRCAVLEPKAGGILLKVVKGTPGSLEKLEKDELEALKVYAHKIKPAGLHLDAISESADELILDLEVSRDRMLIDEDGNSIATGEPVVEKGIESFLQGIDFDGTLHFSKLTAYLQNIPGIIAVHVHSYVLCKPNKDGQMLKEVVPCANGSISPKSGHFVFKIKESTINYV